LPIIGLEPSEIYTLKDEYFDLLPSEAKEMNLAERVFMIDEFLLRPGSDGLKRITKIPLAKGEMVGNRTKVLLHGHCYQKAQPPASDGLPIGVAASIAILESTGYLVETIHDGCCGMAGAFGYEAEHYSLSRQVGRLSLFPSIQQAGTAIIAATGISCKSQIEDETGIEAFHPISLVARKYSR
jgi:Fe-S oxidoreductase